MLLFLVVWATCGAATAFVVDATSPAALREWIDASGTNRARATLLRIEGDTLWLRRSDGQLTTTTLANLSERDRQYVAARPPQPSSDANSPSGPASALESVSDYVETIQQLPGWLKPSQSGADRSLVPSALVYVRVSREFLEDYVERSVHRRKPVRDCILGTRIVGESETRGNTLLTLLPSKDQLSARIDFNGTVRAHTRGYNGPVVLHNISDSTFRAAKLVAMDGSGLRVAPATAVAPTRLRTTRIDTSLPWLRGRIATRIAWRCTASSHGRAEAINAERTADDIRNDLDARVDRSMAKLQKVFGSKIPDLEAGTSTMRTNVRFHSSADCLEIAIIREDASPEERKLRPPAALKNSDVAVRVHRILFTSAIEDPQLMQDLTPLFGKLLQARAGPNGDEGAGVTPGAKDADAKWALDPEWLSLDFRDANR